MLIVALAFFILFDGRDHYNWYKGNAGYQQALKQSQLNNSPMLIYIRKENCHYCNQFEKELLRDALVQIKIDPYIKIIVISSANENDENDENISFNKEFPVNTYPALFVKRSAKYPAVSTHLLMETSQIWVSRPSYQRGNFMPLSSVTLPLSIKTALIESEARGQ